MSVSLTFPEFPRQLILSYIALNLLFPHYEYSQSFPIRLHIYLIFTFLVSSGFLFLVSDFSDLFLWIKTPP